MIKSGSFQIYRYFQGDEKIRDIEKKNFISDKIRNPSLDYPLLKKRPIINCKNSLIELKREIRKKEKNEVVRKAYFWKIEEKIAELELALAALGKDRKNFKRYSEIIYGKPKKEIFDFSARQLVNFAARCSRSSNAELKITSRALEKIFNGKYSKKFKLKSPSKRELDYVEKFTRGELAGILDFTNKEKKYGSAEIKKVFDSIINKNNTEGWKLKIVSVGGTAIDVDKEKKQINIPRKKVLSCQGLCNLILHEIGTHIIRGINGRKSRLGLLGIGLDRSEIGEEGIATAREQSISRNIAGFSGLEGYLAVGLAYGLNGKKGDFRDLYEIFVKIYLVYGLSLGMKIAEAKKRARLRSWERCIRTFRGTTCDTPGICFTKDLIYRQGNINIWRVIRNNPREIRRFSAGKYDPSNPRHIRILDQLGIK